MGVIRKYIFISWYYGTLFHFSILLNIIIANSIYIIYLSSQLSVEPQVELFTCSIILVTNLTMLHLDSLGSQGEVDHQVGGIFSHEGHSEQEEEQNGLG